MSKGANIFTHINTHEPDGHVIKLNVEYGYVSCYCPVARDHVSATMTSNGVKCDHCHKHIQS